MLYVHETFQQKNFSQLDFCTGCDAVKYVSYAVLRAHVNAEQDLNFSQTLRHEKMSEKCFCDINFINSKGKAFVANEFCAYFWFQSFKV